MKKTTALFMALFTVSTLSYAAPLRYFGQTDTTYQSRTAYGNNADAGQYATADDGTKIYFERYSKGSPVVVLHGGLVGSPAEMSEFIDNLVKDHEVIVVNTRGHGKSELATAMPTYAQKAKDLSAVLKTAKIDGKAALLGFSDGAYTALEFGKDYPAQTAKIVAIGAGEWKKGFIQGGGDKRAAYADVKKLDPAYWQEQQTVRPDSAHTADWFNAAQRNYDNTAVGAETFADIQAPVLYVVGEDDANAPLYTVIAAYRITPHADLSVIPNTTHPAYRENFPAVWAAVEPFLAAK